MKRKHERMKEREIGNELILLLGVIILPVYLHNNPILLSFNSGLECHDGDRRD